MAALQDYARLALFLDGTHVKQITSLHHVTNSGQQRVDLLIEGLSGFTPGSGDVELDIGYVVPVGGQEFPYQQKTANGDYVAVQLVQGGEQYVGNGKFITTDGGQNVNANLEGTAHWVGQLKPFQS